MGPPSPIIVGGVEKAFRHTWPNKLQAAPEQLYGMAQPAAFRLPPLE